MNYFDSIYSSNLPSRAISVYMYLRHRANSDGQCWPSERLIGRDLSMSKSTVRRALHDLTAAGYIKSEQTYRKTGAKSTLLFTIADFKSEIQPRGKCLY